MKNASKSSGICVICRLLPLCQPFRPVQRSQWIRRQRHARVFNRPYTRPSFAPKPLLDIRHIAQNPGLYEQNCIDRNYEKQAQNSWEILRLRKERADIIHQARALREENNQLQELMKKRPSNRTTTGQTQDDTANDAESSIFRQRVSRATFLKKELERFAKEEKDLEERMVALALLLPNLSSDRTPVGSSPELLQQGQPPWFSNDRSLSHKDVGVELDLIDFSAGATSSGYGWYFLKNEAALMEQALIQYALGVLVKYGWKIVSPPSLVYSHIASACGFQPRDQNNEQQIYRLERPDRDANDQQHGLCLAATAEIPLAAMKAGTTLTEAELPLKVAAVSRCYRAEAGARGLDTKGLYRVHEFTKVEMFAWTMPDRISSDSEHGDNMGYFASAEEEEEAQVTPAKVVFDEMIKIQIQILEELGLKYRVLEMPTQELGASASWKQDIEVYFPSRKHKDDGWGEVTSASNCTDYQTRRLATRLQTSKGQTAYPYTLNGTALAIPRILAALLEYGYPPATQPGDPNLSITIPDCLRPWMGGKATIP